MPRPDRHRDLLVAAAAQQLRRKGYAALSTAAVLQEAGATNGSLYHHFPGGKQELARTALEASAAMVERSLRAALERGPDVRTAVASWVASLVAALESDALDGCPVAPTATESVMVSEELRATAAAAFASWTALVADALEEHLSRDEAVERARVVLSLVEGALLLDRVSAAQHHLRAVAATLPLLLPDA